MKLTHNRWMSKASLAFAAFAALGLSAKSEAALVFKFDNVIYGDTPSGSSPWAMLTIDDYAPNKVSFTLSHTGSGSPKQYISSLLLNSELLPKKMKMIESSPIITGFNYGSNSYSAPFGNRFDIKVSFGTSSKHNGYYQLNPGESVSWIFEGKNLTADHFLSTTKSGWYNMIYVEGIPEDCYYGFSKVTGDYCQPPTEQPVPEPASLAALGFGAAALLRRRRAKKA